MGRSNSLCGWQTEPTASSIAALVSRVISVRLLSMFTAISTNGQGGAPLVLLGQGCGATGILMMQVLQEAGMLKIDVPLTCDAVLQAPYLSPRPNYANRFLGLLARVPGGSNLSAWSFLPSLTADATGSRRFAAARQREQVQVRVGALRRFATRLADHMDASQARGQAAWPRHGVAQC